jgi:hypothetical protein
VRRARGDRALPVSGAGALPVKDREQNMIEV